MPIPVQQFQILSPEQANPYGTALHQAMQSRLMQAQAQEQEAKNPFVAAIEKERARHMGLENKWYEPNIQSEISLRGQQGAHLGSETAKNTWLLKHPGAMYGGDAAFLEYIKGQYPHLNQTNSSQGGQPSQNASMGQPGQSPQMGQPGQSAQMPQQQNAQSGQNDSSIYFNREPNIGPNFNTGNSLVDSILAQKFKSPQSEYDKQVALENYKTQNELYKTDAPKLQAASNAANKTISDVNQFVNAYDQIKFAKGPMGSLIGNWSGPAKDAERLGQRLVNEEAKQLQSAGHVTDKDFTFAGRAKLGTDMPEETKNRFSNIFKSGAIRTLEHEQFIAQAKARGVNKDVAETAFNLYQQQRPGMNQEDGQYYMNNAYLNTANDYLTPEALNSIVSTGTYRPPNQDALKAQNINKNDIETAAKSLKLTVSDTMKMIENPGTVDPAVLSRIPVRIRLEMMRHAGGGK